MSKPIEHFLLMIPNEFHDKITLLEKYRGKRTEVSFEFGCGCKVEKSLYEICKGRNLQHCLRCRPIKPRGPKIFKCNFCCSEFVNELTYNECFKNCSATYGNLQEGKDFVICSICGLHAKSLAMHLRMEHQLNKNQYNGQVICNASSDRYGEAAIANGNWIEREKANGSDLAEFRKKVSEGVKRALDGNEKESKRRAEVMTRVNQSDVMRKKASDTAKITSARPEIQKARAERLQRWRKNNPELFYEISVKKLATAYQSKPEIRLFEFVSKIEGFKFKRNQFVKSPMISNISNKKQVDMGDKEKRIYIEFDGSVHFKPMYGQDRLERSQQLDRELEEYISSHNWTLIRVSQDQYLYRTKSVNKEKSDVSHFKQECLDKIVEILNSGVPGIYKIGELYGKH